MSEPAGVFPNKKSVKRHVKRYPAPEPLILIEIRRNNVMWTSPDTDFSTLHKKFIGCGGGGSWKAGEAGD
jgi:hypothetical protein